MTALERWQLTGHGGELRLGEGLLRGPAKHDPHFGTCWIETRLARGPLRPPLRMRLYIDHWSATPTALALTPCQRVRPGTAYFQAGRRLLDSLTCGTGAPTGEAHGRRHRQPPTVVGLAWRGLRPRRLKGPD